MYCKNCGNALDELDNFCRVCGSKVNGGETTFVNSGTGMDEGREEPLDLDRFLVFDEKKENEQKKIDEEYENLKNKIFNKTPEITQESKPETNSKRKPESKPEIPVNQVQEDFDEDDNDEDEDYDYLSKKSPAKKVFLLIAIVLFVVASAVGVRYFLLQKGSIPSSNNVSASTEENKNQTTKPAVKPNENATPSGVTTGAQVDKNIPEADKNKLIAGLSYLNKNIQEVKANDSLKYNPDKEYRISDVTHSKPLTENFWTEKDGKKYYYDESIVGTLISFNSKWIDFVNHRDRSVLKLTKKGSKAYKNIVTFTSHSTKEDFKLFEIGDIRKGEFGYYVWTHEIIKATKSGRTETREYHYIYLLEPNETTLSVVNYYELQ